MQAKFTEEPVFYACPFVTPRRTNSGTSRHHPMLTTVTAEINELRPLLTVWLFGDPFDHRAEADYKYDRGNHEQRQATNRHDAVKPR